MIGANHTHKREIVYEINSITKKLVVTQVIINHLDNLLLPSTLIQELRLTT